MSQQGSGSPFQVGESVRYVGRTTIQDGEMTVLLEPGMVGSIAQASRGWIGLNGRVHEGHSSVVFPNGFSRTILRKHFSRYERT